MKKKILIVDDEKILRDSIKTFLERNDFEVCGAANGREALDKMEWFLPDAVICDIEMPIMNGFTFFSHLRDNERTSFIPFIFLTGKIENSVMRQSMASGADDYIMKPFQFNDILDSLKTRLEKSEKRIRKIEEKNIEILDGKKAFNSAADKYLQILNEREKRYCLLIQKMPEIIFTLDENANFIFINESIKNLGYKPFELAGKPFKYLLPESDVHKFELEFKNFINNIAKFRDFTENHIAGKNLEQTLMPDFEFELMMRDKNQINDSLRAFKIKISYNPVFSIQKNYEMESIYGLSSLNNHIEIIGIAIDITHLKNIEKLKIKSAALEETARLKTEFINNISHEMRTPLTAILGYAETIQRMIKRNMPLEEYAGLLNNISTSADHLMSIINDLLDISKIEAGKINLNNECFNLKDIIDEVYDIFKSKFCGNEFKIEFSSHNIKIFADRLRLRQIFINLIDNAIKYSDNPVHINIRAEFNNNLMLDDEKIVEISIADNGCGIPENNLDDIWFPFHRLPQSEKVQGTGLGLAITKKLVESMNGSISLKSKVGVGSVFTIMLKQ